MVTTEHRPAPLPARAGQPAADTPTNVVGDFDGGARRLPPGATHWSKSYYDDHSRRVDVKRSVPVNAAGKIAAVELECPQCGEQSRRWLPAALRVPPSCPLHGVDLQPVAAGKGAPLLPWDEMWRRSKHRLGVAAATVSVGVVGVVLDQAAMPWWGHAAQLAAIPASVVGSWWLTRWWLTWQARKRGALNVTDEVAGARRRRKIAIRARIAAYLVASATGWIELADLVGIDVTDARGPVLLAALGVVGVAGSRPYLRWVDARRAVRPPLPTVEGEADTPAPPTGEGDGASADARRDAADWETTVAVIGGLPGTAVDVSTWRADEGGRRMVIRNVGRKAALTEERLQQVLPLMAGAFDVPRSAIGWVAEHDGSPNAVELLVQPNSPLNERIPGEPIDIVPLGKAVVHMGRRIDGTPLVTRLFTPGWGSPSRLILGTKGSGKTELIRRLLLAQLRARIAGPTGPVRLVAPFMHDPKRGADFGAFRRQVCGFSIESDTLHMIVEAFSREMDRRYDALASMVWRDAKGREREGERPFDPLMLGPILSLVIDEWHVNAKDQELMAKLDPFGRKMRAAGIEINAATHAATIGDTGSQGFRDMLAGGEAWLLRTTMGLNAALATGGTLTGDPRALPRVPGMVLHSSGEDVTMQARVAYDDPETVYDLLYDDDNNSRIQPIEWPAETLEAFGSEFVQWMRESQRRPLGSAAVAAPKSYKPSVDGGGKSEDVRAFDVLLEILAGSREPLRRPQIMEDTRWGWHTKTLTNVLRAAQDINPPAVVKVSGSSGAYEITESGRFLTRLERERAEAARTESAEGAE